MIIVMSAQDALSLYLQAETDLKSTIQAEYAQLRYVLETYFRGISQRHITTLPECRVSYILKALGILIGCEWLAHFLSNMQQSC